jgi:hypothetical protein
MRNYPDYFASVGKVMLKRQDGTFTLISEQEFNLLKRSNKLSLETPKTMGGRVTDLTQKPIVVLKE